MADGSFHFELNWIGVTAGLLEELRTKCAAQAERYGLRFVEAPVEQVKDISLKCPYRAPIPIRLALAPPVIPDLAERLSDLAMGQGQTANWFEYAILTRRFGFILDVEATSRYPSDIKVQYKYRGPVATYEYSQFCHRSGVALVQCIGGTEGFLWSDNRLFIAAPTKSRGTHEYPNAPVPLKLTKQESARALRRELEEFCADPVALKAFYDEITPPPRAVDSSDEGEGDANGDVGVDIPKINAAGEDEAAKEEGKKEEQSKADKGVSGEADVKASDAKENKERTKGEGPVDNGV